MNSAELVQAAFEADLEKCRRCLEEGADIESRDFVGHLNLTPLMAACWGNKEESLQVVAMLLDSGADVNATDERGETALALAASAHRIDICTLLIERGADLNRRRDDGPALISLLAAANAVDLVRRQISDRSVPPDPCELDDLLFDAASGPAPDVVMLLLELGADPNAETGDGGTPLFSNMDAETVRVLIEAGADPLRHTPFGSPLACTLNHENRSQEQIRATIAGAEKVADVDWNRYLPLALLRIYRDPEAVAMMLDFGADPNFRSEQGRTPLHHFSRGEDGLPEYRWSDKFEPVRQEIVRILVEGGADLEAVDEAGMTPLLAAIYGGYPRASLALLRFGANANARVRGTQLSGRTPLMFAFQDSAVVEALLAAGAEPGLRCPSGRTALDYARMNLDAPEEMKDDIALAVSFGWPGEEFETYRQLLRAETRSETLRSIDILRALA